MNTTRRRDVGGWLLFTLLTFGPVLIGVTTLADLALLYAVLVVTTGWYEVMVAVVVRRRGWPPRFDRWGGSWTWLVGMFTPMWFFWGILGWDGERALGLWLPAFLGKVLLVLVAFKLVDLVWLFRGRVRRSSD